MAHVEQSPPNPRLAGAFALLVALLSAAMFFMLRGDTRDASLVVRVDPAGAKVRLIEPREPGGADLPEQVAAQGAATFDRLPRGALARAQVSAPGYRQEVAEAQLPDLGGKVVIDVKLRSESALLTVQTKPAGAMVYLDDKPAGMSPLVIQPIGTGAHTVSARKMGFEPASQNVTVEPESAGEVKLNLKALPEPDGGPAAAAVEEEEPFPPGYGRVTVISSHQSTFMVDNQIVGMGTQTTRTVLAGPHLIGCRAHRRGTDTRRVEVVEGVAQTVRFDFPEDPIEKAKRATNPKEPLYWTIKGGTTRNSGKYGEAVEHFQKALELDPDYYPAHRQLGYTLPPLKHLGPSRWDDAIEHMERYIELNPHAPDKEFAEEMVMIYAQKKDEEIAEGK